jgi:hypothetical protein
MLFNFLRRPDTITLSSHYGRGTTGPEDEAELDERPEPAPRFPRMFLPASKRGSEATAAARDERPPWEQLEFVNVGARLESPGILSGGSSRPRTPIDVGRGLSVSISEQSGRTSDTALDAPFLPHPSREHLSPIPSAKDAFEQPDAHLPDFVDEPQRDRQGSQSLAEFFQQYQITPEQASEGAQPVSAAQYFNRQASLLMLYFPLAVSTTPDRANAVHARVFSIARETSVRDERAGPAKSNPVDHIVVVCAVGRVYRRARLCECGARGGADYQGLAELVVRRRVRKKMPDRM